MKRLNDVHEDMLERLFANELQPDDRQRLRRDLDDPDFKSELAFRNALKKVAEQKRVEDPLRKELLRARQINKSGDGYRRLLYSAAAVLLLAIVVSIGTPQIDLLGLYDKTPVAQPDANIADLIRPPTDLSQAGQTQDPGEDNYRSGKIQFRKQQYAPAIESLEQVPAESKYYHVSRFLLAHCYLYTGLKPQEAVSIFESFRKEMNPPSKLAGEYDYDDDKVIWNLMLAYKAAGLQDKYSKLLQFLSNKPDYGFKEDAIELRMKELGK
ncbi:MAG: hypothetical protein JNK77_12120 [Saprospiraceae bacterium]|nr:hypothetical protein [Saprospiraceae bacterium]